MKLTTTLLLPTLNEIEAVRVIIPQIRREWVDEIIVVDGGSTDGTVEFARAAGLRVHSQTTRGYGEGLLEAIRLSRCDVIIEFNPDGNSIPEDIPRIIAKINEGYDLVIGSRYRDGAKSDDDDWLTATGNWMFTRIVNLLFGTQYTGCSGRLSRLSPRAGLAARSRRAGPELALPKLDPLCPCGTARDRDPCA